MTFVQDLPSLPETVSTNSSPSDTLQVNSPHSCNTNRLMQQIGLT